MSRPGAERSLNVAVPTSVIAASLGRPVAGVAGTTVTTNFLDPGELFGERVDEVDLKVAKVRPVHGQARHCRSRNLQRDELEQRPHLQQHLDADRHRRRGRRGGSRPAFSRPAMRASASRSTSEPADRLCVTMSHGTRTPGAGTDRVRFVLAGPLRLDAATLDERSACSTRPSFRNPPRPQEPSRGRAREPRRLGGPHLRAPLPAAPPARRPRTGKAAMAKCAECRALLATFLEDVNRGRAAARRGLPRRPTTRKRASSSATGSQLSVDAAEHARPQDRLGRDGNPSACSKPSSKRIRCTCAPGWRARGWITSSARASRGARAG